MAERTDDWSREEAIASASGDAGSTDAGVVDPTQIRAEIRDTRERLGDTLEEIGERLEARKAELGAPTLADKIDLTKDALAELAKEQEIPGRSKMSQEELAATVAPS